MSSIAGAMRDFSVVAVFAMLFVSSPSFAQGDLQCGNKVSSLPDAIISRDEAQGFVEYEFLFETGDHFWIGVVFEFFGTGDGSILYEAISQHDSPPEVVDKLTSNFQQSIIDSSVYESVEGGNDHVVGGRNISTFLARYNDHVDLYALYGRFVRGKLIFYRVQTAAEDLNNVEQARTEAIRTLDQMIRNCTSSEA